MSPVRFLEKTTLPAPIMAIFDHNKDDSKLSCGSKAASLVGERHYRTFMRIMN